MENKELKNNKIGRPKFIANVQQLHNLYKKIENKELTNEEAWNIAKCGKTKWYELKNLYCRTGGTK